MINTGVSGNSVGDVLAEFDRRVARFAPDVVAMMLGTNDSVEGEGGLSDFASGLAELISRVRAIDAVPYLQTPPPIDTDDAPERAHLDSYVRVVRRVAGGLSVPLVDHHLHWHAQGFTGHFRSDALHPNARGHLELAKELFARLGIFDPGSPTCGLQIVDEGGSAA